MECWVIGALQQVVDGDMEIVGEQNQSAVVGFARTVFVSADAVLIHIQINGKPLLRQISAVSKEGSEKLSVVTSGGRISFGSLKNRDEIYDVLTGLVNEMQIQAAAAPAPAAPQTSDADELAKYKALLDSGAITQEEYDAKKKQLLGL